MARACHGREPLALRVIETGGIHDGRLSPVERILRQLQQPVVGAGGPIVGINALMPVGRGTDALDGVMIGASMISAVVATMRPLGAITPQ